MILSTIFNTRLEAFWVILLMASTLVNLYQFAKGKYSVYKTKKYIANLEEELSATSMDRIIELKKKRYAHAKKNDKTTMLF